MGAHHLWVIDRVQLPGDTTKQEVWDQAEAILNTPLINSFGKSLRIRAAAVDSRGHRGQQVRAFVQRKTLKIPVYAVQGATNRMNRAIAANASNIDKNKRGKTIKGGYGVWNIGTEYCKDFIYGHLASDMDKAPHDSYIRFPEGLEEDYFNGLLSEYYDPQTKKYVQRKGAKYKRNEPIDTIVYAWAIGQHREVLLGLRRNGKPDHKFWDRLEAILEPEGQQAAQPEQEAKPDQQPAAPPKKKKRAAQQQSTGFGSSDWNI